MEKPLTVAIIEADNWLVGCTPPTNDDIEKHPPETLPQLVGEFLYSQNLISSRPRNASNIPMLGPLYAASLLKKRYPGGQVRVSVHVPWISKRATTHEGIAGIIADADVVVVSAVTFFSWAQKEIIRMAHQMGKKTIATGAHARMSESARGLLVERSGAAGKAQIPRSRHAVYNDELVDFPGADYVLQHDHYNAFLSLIELMRSGGDSPGAVAGIAGVGFIDADGRIAGLTDDPRQMIVPGIPDLVLDFTLVEGYGEGISILPLPGSAQGCINSCEFCQIKQFMGSTFLYTPPGRTYENLRSALDAKLLKRCRTKIGAWLNNNIFFTDDSPLIGGELERRLPFDYIELAKIMDHIWSLNGGRAAGQSPAKVRIPQESYRYIQDRNPYLLQRMELYGLKIAVTDIPLSENSPRPIALAGMTLAQAVAALEEILATRANNPEARPYFAHAGQEGAGRDVMGRQLRRNFIEFCRMLDEVELFERRQRCMLSISIEISTRAVRLLHACNPCALGRMRSLGFDMLQIGIEDILGQDTRGTTGIVKATYEENCDAMKVCSDNNMGCMALLICPTQHYMLGDAKKMTAKIMELGADFFEVFSDKAWEGTPLTRKHIEHGRCLHQVAAALFSGPWRELENALQGGEVVTTRPDNASMLGLQLDILDAYYYFNKIANRWAHFRQQVRKGAFANAVYYLTVSVLNQSIIQDLFRWLCRVPVRNGKCYLQILAEADDRWKQEPYTQQLIDAFGIRGLVTGTESKP